METHENAVVYPVARSALPKARGFGKRLPSEAPPVLTPSEREKLKAQAESDGQLAVGPNSNGTVEGSN